MGKENKITVTGDILLEIDELEVRAYIHYTPREDGSIWDAEAVQTLIKEKGIYAPATYVEIEKAFLKWQKLKEPQSLEVGTGVEPEPTEHEKLEWKELSIPGHLKEQSEKSFAAAGPPELFRTVKEKVKVEKVVTKKGLLPFIKAKETKVDEWEHRETVEKIEVDPEVKLTGFVSPETLLGTIVPGKIGKAGLNVFDKPIPPEKIHKVELHPGTGIKRQKNDIIAALQGFVRIGENWIDIVPYKIHTLTLASAREGKLCLMDFEPGAPTSDFPDMEKMLEEAKELGFRRSDLIDPEEIIFLIKKSIDEGTPVKGFVLNKSQDGSILFDIASDKSFARMTIYKASGKGKAITLQEVGKEISKQKIAGLDKEQLKKDLQAFFKSKKKALIDYTLAEGQSAKRGTDGSLDFLVDFLVDDQRDEIISKLKTRPEATQGIFPLEEIEKIAPVTDGMLVAKIIPPTGGETGVDINKEVIPAMRGNDPDIRLMEGLTLSRENIHATRDGILEVKQETPTVYLRVREYRDGKAEVKFPEDKTAAYLTLFPPRGIGKPLTLEDVMKELKQKDVIQGINTDRLKEAVKKVEAGEEVRDLLIAAGVPPVHGSGKRLIFYVLLPRETELSENEVELTRTEETVIRKDTLIAELMPPAVKPQNGSDIFGIPIIADPGPDMNVHSGEGVLQEESESGSIRFIARTDGEILYKDHTISILNMQIIEGDVGPQTGHIQTITSVKVEGSLMEGYKLISKGNVTIGGNITDAMVSAGGSLKVEGTVNSKGKAILKAAKGITLANVRGSILYTPGDLNIRGSSLGCMIKSGGKVINSGPKSYTAGGRIKAREGMEFMHLGTEKQIPTFVHFGQDYLIGEKIEAEQKEINKLIQQQKQLDQQIEQLEKKDSKDKEKLYKFRKTRRMIAGLLEKRRERMREMNFKQNSFYPGEVKIHGTLFPGVKIESRGKIYEVNERKSKIILYFDEEYGIINSKPIKF